MEIRINLPSVEGVDFQDPWQMEEYFASRDTALRNLVLELSEKMNNPRNIVLPSGATLADGQKENPLWPGCIWAVDSTMAEARRQAAARGCRVCDGSHGTPDLRHRFLYGADESDSQEYGAGTMSTPTENQIVNCAASGNEVLVAASNHKHTIDEDAPIVRHYKIIWVRKMNE